MGASRPAARWSWRRAELACLPLLLGARRPAGRPPARRQDGATPQPPLLVEGPEERGGADGGAVLA
eukprot:2835509-Alexandrium_andersonii.AAC.1